MLADCFLVAFSLASQRTLEASVRDSQWRHMTAMLVNRSPRASDHPPGLLVHLPSPVAQRAGSDNEYLSTPNDCREFGEFRRAHCNLRCALIA